MARIDESMVEGLNAQIGRELLASQQYLAMAIWLEGQSLESLAKFYHAQALEERGHAMKIIHYLTDVGQVALVPAVPEPKAAYESLREVVERSLAYEKDVTDAIHALVDAASAAKDHATFHFLQWFVDEQVEEEASFSRLLDVIAAARDMIQVDNYVRRMTAGD